VIGEVRALLAAAPLGAFLRGIDIPVLVLHGEDDQSWNAVEQALLVRSVAGAEHAVIAAAAHCPQLENPKAWVATVADFLARADDIGARPPSAT
jgi:pimeloyl-ACP methyl ester carboxylesterase